jgi:elongation factor Ts
MAVGVPAKDVKELRERTGAGMMECKAALEEAGGDRERAVEILKVRGQAKADKRAGRTAAEGAVGSYVHANGKIGVLVEVDCETDFVARSDEFRQFAQEVALHVAWANPRWVSDDEVPEDVKEAELRIFREQAAADDKPPEVQEKMAEGRLRKWLEAVVLLRQEHAKHEGKTIEELRAELASRTGENVVIRRFARLAVGED